MKLFVVNVAAVAAIAVFAGCGGGASPPYAMRPGVNTEGPPTAQDGRTRATVTLVLSSLKATKNASLKNLTAGERKRDYVAPTTQGIIAEFAGSDASSDITYQGYTLSPGVTASSTSPASCGAAADDGSFTCTLSLSLAPNITYATTLTAYDVAQSGTSAQPATGSKALSTATQNLTVAAGAANTFAFTLSGIVEGFSISPQYVGVDGASSGTGLFQAQDADGNSIDQYDGTTAFTASFPVVASDENETCATQQATAKRRARKRSEAASTNACLTTTSSDVTGPTSETVNFAYNGGGYGGDGTAGKPPYYGEIALTPPMRYGGPVSGGNAASLFIVPFFGFVDSSNTYASGTASVAFTAAGQSIAAYATQYHPPTGAPTDGSGYTVDASSCGQIASVGTPAYTAGVGIAFTITAGSLGGSCTLKLSDDGTSTGADTATISITNSLPTPKLVQSNMGIGTVSLPNDVAAGDVLVLAIENFEQESNAFPSSYGNFMVFPAAEDESTSVYLADVTSSGALSPFALGGPTETGGTTYWIGEFSDSNAAAIMSANSAINGVGGSTVTITPNAQSGLVLVAAENGSNTAPANYQQFTEDSGQGSQIQIDLSQLPTSDTTDALTFDFGANADSESAIQIAPTGFSGTQSMVRRRAIDPDVLRRHLTRLRMRLSR